MFFNLLLTVLFTRYIHASSDPVYISGNTIATEQKYIVGSPEDGITVAPGVFWSLFVDEHAFQSNSLLVQDSAAFYLTNTDKSGAMEFESLVNYNLVAISSSNVKSSAAVTISGQTMQNNGNLFISNATQVIFSGDQWKNTGSVSIEASVNSHGVVSISNSGSSLVNSGDICLSRVSYDMNQQLYGGGCIHLFEGTLSVLKIEPYSKFDNTIVLNGPNSVLSFIPSGSHYIVSGFGGGNAITFTFTNENNVMKFEYDKQTGILAITSTAGVYEDYFDIGLGYTSTLFKAGDGGGVIYTGTAPNLLPSKCGACPSTPIAPSPDNP